MLATRKALAPVGSATWINKEQEHMYARQVSCIEDFSLSVRNDFLWLNEYMFDVVSKSTKGQREDSKIFELLKTPGRLRGKTPKFSKKHIATVRISNPSPYVTPSNNLFRKQSRKTPTRKSLCHSQHRQTIVSPVSALSADSIVVSPVIQQTASQVYNDTTRTNNKDTSVHNAINILRDSGICTSVTSDDVEHATGQSTPEKLIEVKHRLGATGLKATSPISSGTSALELRTASPNISDLSARPHYSDPGKSTSLSQVSFEERDGVHLAPGKTENATVDEGKALISQGLASKQSTSVISNFTQHESIESPSHTPSPPSQPVRSSLNFASLPARETINLRKSNSILSMSRKSQLLGIGGRLNTVGTSSTGKQLLEDIPPSSASQNGLLEHDIVKVDSIPLKGKRLASTENQPLVDDFQPNDHLKALSTPTTAVHVRISHAAPSSRDILPLLTSEQTSESFQSPSCRHPDTDRIEAAESESEDEWIPARAQSTKSNTLLDYLHGTPCKESQQTISNLSKSMNGISTFTSTCQESPLSARPLLNCAQISTLSPHEAREIRNMMPISPQKSPFRSPSPYKSPFDSALSAVKSHQANLFNKAKQMLFSKGKSEMPNDTKFADQARSTILPVDSLSDNQPNQVLDNLNQNIVSGTTHIRHEPVPNTLTKLPMQKKDEQFSEANTVVDARMMNGIRLDDRECYSTLEVLSDDDQEQEVQPSKLPKPTPTSSRQQLQSLYQQSSTSRNAPVDRGIRMRMNKPSDPPVKSLIASSAFRSAAASGDGDQRKAPLGNNLIKSFIDTRSLPHTKESSTTCTIGSDLFGNSLKTSKSGLTGPFLTKPLKKDHDEREKKKQEIEKRRQENIKREDERRRLNNAKLKKNLEKALDDDQKKDSRLHIVPKVAMSSVKPSVRVNNASSLKKPMEQAMKTEPLIPMDIKRQPKRNLEMDEVKQRQPMLANHAKIPENEGSRDDSKPDEPTSCKRRRTIESESISDVQYKPSHISIVPDRVSTVKPGIFSQVSSPGTNNLPRHFTKMTGSYQSSLQAFHSAGSQNAPHVDIVKYSQDNIKFASVTPSHCKLDAQTQGPTRPSPVYPNGDTIDLPEIQTDSEDESDEGSFNVPIWAESPELRAALKKQLAIDPEAVFGPMPPLSMEDIFRGRGDRTHARFRTRTSSANWGGQDRLTTAEIEADRLERQKMIDNNGWTYN